MLRLPHITVYIFLALFLSACATETQQTTPAADLIIINGNIITLDENMSTAEAVAIRDGKIWKIGSSAEMQEYTDAATETLDLNGATVIPAFIEGHGHFIGLGNLKRNIDLTATTNYAEVVAMVKEKIGTTPEGEWIMGRGWHQEKWDSPLEKDVLGFPYHDLLSDISPDHPVILHHASGHAILANRKAMELAGIDASTPDPTGGRILRSPEGAPIGIFEENAERLILDKYDEYMSRLTAEELYEQWRTAARLAQEESFKKGITSFVDAGITVEEMRNFQRWKGEGELQMRMSIMLGDELAKLKEISAELPILDTTEHLLQVRAIKKYMDGALGSRGAWLLQPYEDDPGNTGQQVNTLQLLTEYATFAAGEGMQLCIHAIGDRANREVLNIYEKAFLQYPNSERLRWRIEHAQHIHPEDIPRFANLGVIASVQPIHCTSDAPFVIKRLGEQRAGESAYPWRKLIDAGAMINSGTDTPVESVDPLENFFAAITRKPAPGQPAFYSGQKMTRMEALKAYTLHNAYGIFRENIQGSIATGKLADLVVLSEDILKVGEEEFTNIKILYTISGGKIVYNASM